MSATLDAAIRAALPRVVAMAPDGIDAWGVRVQARDRISRNGYRWPAPGEWAAAPGSPQHDLRRACADHPGDGIHVAREMCGTYSVVPVERIAIVGWREADVYGSSEDKVRLSCAWVGALLTIPAALRILYGANLYGADLYGADLGGAYLGGADLREADLGGAYLGGANLRAANLSRANLCGANLRGADLYGAYLYGANLRGADLHGANLRGADLHGADLRGADLHGANLHGAYLRGARGVPEWAIRAAEVST